MRIERDESVDQGCKRIVWETLAKAVELARDEALEPDERVHEVRLCLKRARAVIALVATEAGKPALRDDRRLRRIGRALGPWRDRAVAREALARLSETRGRGGAVMPSARLERWLRAALATGDAEARLAEAAAALERAGSAGGIWRIDQGRRAVSAGFEDAYRRARRAYRRADEEAAPKRFHSWRKAVKRLGYQAELLEKRAPAAGSGGARLKKLARLLGDLHDLEVLREVLERAGREVGRGEVPEALLAVVDTRDRELRLAARVLGAVLFAERPAAVGHRVRASWIS